MILFYHKMLVSNNRTIKKIVFASMSKASFYWRENIIRFILEAGHTPLCAFMMFSYFLLDTVDRKALIDANNDLVRLSDEIWVFGKVSSGVKEELKIAKKLGIFVKYFMISETKTYLAEGELDITRFADRIQEIKKRDVKYE